MIKLLLIAPGNLPIPATKGGAIETLITNLIDANEIYQLWDITVFSNWNEQAQNLSTQYKYTKILYVKKKSFRVTCYDFFHRILKKLSHKRTYYHSYYLQKIYRYLEENVVDHIVVEGQIDYIIPISKHKKDKQTLLLHLHTDILNIETQQGANIINSCDKILTVSNYVKQQVLKVVPDYKHIEVYKNGIDTEKFHSRKHHRFRTILRSRHGIGRKDKIILFCGRIDESKGVKELIKAVLLSQVKESIYLLIVGSSWFDTNHKTKYIKELKLLAKSLGDHIIFTGYVKHCDIAKYYAAADIAVVPSQCNEAAGLVILEALSSGLPVIATNIGGIPEYTNEDSCLLINKDDQFVYHLSKTIDHVCMDEEFYDNLKKLCRLHSKKFGLYDYYHNLNNSMININR